MTRTAYYTKEEADERLAESSRIHFPSNFAFLREHNGLRKGKVHTILGPSHSGKSTLVRSLLVDTMENLKEDENALVVLSEESHDDFVTELMQSQYSTEALKRLIVTTEFDLWEGLGGTAGLINGIENMIEKNGVSVVFYDNITTSTIYMDGTPREQSEFLKLIKYMTIRKNIAMVLVAHTMSSVKENHHEMISMEQVRGTKTLTNLSEFFYILQNFKSGNNIHSTLRIAKHRSQDVKEPFYLMVYSPERRIYCASAVIDFEKVKGIFNTRNVL